MLLLGLKDEHFSEFFGTYIFSSLALTYLGQHVVSAVMFRTHPTFRNKPTKVQRYISHLLSRGLGGLIWFLPWTLFITSEILKDRDAFIFQHVRFSKLFMYNYAAIEVYDLIQRPMWSNYDLVAHHVGEIIAILYSAEWGASDPVFMIIVVLGAYHRIMMIPISLFRDARSFHELLLLSRFALFIWTSGYFLTWPLVGAYLSKFWTQIPPIWRYCSFGIFVLSIVIDIPLFNYIHNFMKKANEGLAEQSKEKEGAISSHTVEAVSTDGDVELVVSI
jgi:hypothetical protein